MLLYSPWLKVEIKVLPMPELATINEEIQISKTAPESNPSTNDQLLRLYSTVYNFPATNLTKSDRTEYLKRLNHRPPSLTQLTRQIQSQLPNYPVEIILETIV